MAADARQKEITRDLDAYISTKRKGGGLFGLFTRQESDTVGPREEPLAQTPLQEEQDVVAEEETVMEHEEPAEPVPAPADSPNKKRWFSRFFNEQEQQQAAPVIAAPSADEDLREVARISLSFLRQADAEALARIKSSPDFERFKEILRKHNVIK